MHLAQMTFLVGCAAGTLSAAAIYNVTVVQGATDLSNSGYITGGLISGGAYLYKNGVFTNLGTFEGGPFNTVGVGVNNQGDVAGDINFGNISQARAFINQGGVFRDLGTLGNGIEAVANAINDSGEVVGQSKVAARGSQHELVCLRLSRRSDAISG